MRHRLDLWVRKILWRRTWQPTPILLPGKSHGQRNLWRNRSSMARAHRVELNITEVT